MGARRRTRGTLSLLAAGAILLTAGCTGGDDEAGAGTTLNWFVAIQPGGTIQEVAQRCSEESDGRYTVEVELLPTLADQQREQLVRRLGAEDSTVDIIGMDVIWTAEFANAGWLRPWEGELEQQVTESVFAPVLETASFEGQLYGAPFNSNTQLLWYRTDEVEEPPATWEEMIADAEEAGGFVQVQANRYEGYTVWANTMIQSAGTEILAGPTEVDLEQAPTEAALSVIGQLSGSPAAAPNIDTSTEDTARLGFEAGDSPFMLNYTFAFASAGANAPEIAENMDAAKLPRVVPDQESRPPLGGFNLGVSAFSENPELAFEAAACLSNAESQLTATELDGLPPSREDLYEEKVVQDAFPDFADDIRRSIATAAPRPLTPAYTDLSLAIQRALHSPSKIDPQDPGPVYDDLLDKIEQAVLREGLL
ncbi:MAG: extracellular solute-binding protein [Solirubrobacterales bacterium]